MTKFCWTTFFTGKTVCHQAKEFINFAWQIHKRKGNTFTVWWHYSEISLSIFSSTSLHTLFLAICYQLSILIMINNPYQSHYIFIDTTKNLARKKMQRFIQCYGKIKRKWWPVWIVRFIIYFSHLKLKKKRYESKHLFVEHDNGTKKNFMGIFTRLNLYLLTKIKILIQKEMNQY